MGHGDVDPESNSVASGVAISLQISSSSKLKPSNQFLGNEGIPYE